MAFDIGVTEQATGEVHLSRDCRDRLAKPQLSTNSRAETQLNRDKRAGTQSSILRDAKKETGAAREARTAFDKTCLSVLRKTGVGKNDFLSSNAVRFGF